MTESTTPPTARERCEGLALSLEACTDPHKHMAAKVIRDLMDALSEGISERERLERLVYVPGVWKCAKCALSLVSNTINANTGAMKANTSPQECLNGCGPMWRVTERDAGNDLCDRLDAASLKLRASTDYAEALRNVVARYMDLHISDDPELNVSADARRLLAKNPVNAEPSASTQSAGTMESALNPGPHSEALRDAACAVVDAYTSRFEGNGPHKLFGPIDSQVIDLMEALALKRSETEIGIVPKDPRHAALDRLAEIDRELGLDCEPPQRGLAVGNLPWVALKDRLPEDGVSIVVFNPINQYRSRVNYEVKMYARPDWLSDGDRDTTHWLQLSPPDAENSQDSISDAEVKAREVGVREGLKIATDILWATPLPCTEPTEQTGRDRLRSAVSVRLHDEHDRLRGRTAQNSTQEPKA